MARNHWILLTSCVLVLAAGLGASAWVAARRAEAERREGLRVATQTAALLRRVRALGLEADPRAAQGLLTQAADLLRGAGGDARNVPLASVLADLATAQLSPAPGDPGRRSAAARLLDEAWALPGLPAPLRARIARDQGALHALEGDLAGAEGWYAEAARLLPSDLQARARLDLLEETAPAPSTLDP